MFSGVDMLYQDAFLQRLEEGIRTALPNWGLGSGVLLDLLAISENATYVTDDRRSGRRMVLRVHRPGYHSEAEILSELAWLEALRRDGVVETPRPIPARDGSLLCSFTDGGSRRSIVAFEHMPGKEPTPTDHLTKWYERLGAINARLHMHARAWQKPANFVRKVWNFDTIIGSRAYWGDWRQGLGLEAEGRAVLERTAAALKDRTDRYGQAPERFGLVHCDMRPANLLVDADRLAVIDFDDCGLSWFAYDFAAAVSFLENEPYVDELRAAWTAGYREVAPLSAEDEAALPMFMMLRRMQLTAWVASHAETPTAQSMGVPFTRGTIEMAERYLGTHA